MVVEPREKKVHFCGESRLFFLAFGVKWTMVKCCLITVRGGLMGGLYWPELVNKKL